MKCNECKIDFPEGLIQPMITTKGNTICCAVCALDIRNKIHGLNDKKFQGVIANQLLLKTKKYLRLQLTRSYICEYQMEIKLPTKYTPLSSAQKRAVREEYITQQKGKCFYCGESLMLEPPKRITDKEIDWDLFPDNFLKYPIHLQHNHDTDMTEGAVHSYCNAVMWTYEHR